METALGKADYSWGVRGNIFSFLLPWEKVLSQLFEKVEDGDLSDWPLSPETVLHLVRVQVIRGPKDLPQQFRDLKIFHCPVRPKVLKGIVVLVQSGPRFSLFRSLFDPVLGPARSGTNLF